MFRLRRSILGDGMHLRRSSDRRTWVDYAIGVGHEVRSPAVVKCESSILIGSKSRRRISARNGGVQVPVIRGSEFRHVPYDHDHGSGWRDRTYSRLSSAVSWVAPARSARSDRSQARNLADTRSLASSGRPFDSERRAMSVVVGGDMGGATMYTKGAPEVVLSRCVLEWRDGRIEPLDEARRAAIRRDAAEMAARALRVLGMAFRRAGGWQLRPLRGDRPRLRRPGRHDRPPPRRGQIRGPALPCRGHPPGRHYRGSPGDGAGHHARAGYHWTRRPRRHRGRARHPRGRRSRCRAQPDLGLRAASRPSTSFASSGHGRRAETSSP